MDVSVLHNWVEHNGEYVLGVKLYEKFGDDNSLKFLFTKTPYSKFNAQKLRSALVDIAAKHKKPVVKAKVEFVAARPSAAKAKINRNNLPTGIVEFYDENVKLLAERQDMHSQLLHLAGNELELTKAANFILDAGDTIKKNWAVIDDFLSTGVVKEAPKAKVDTPQHSEGFYFIKNRIQLCMQNISRAKRNKDEEGIKKWEAKKAEWQKKLSDEGFSGNK